MAFLSRDQVSDVFLKRGWVRKTGGQLYFDGNGGSAHPHLHMSLNGHNTVPVGGDARRAVDMLAWSDGGQGRGGGGRSFIQDGQVRIRSWQGLMPQLKLSGDMTEELAHVMSYFTLG